MALYLLNCSVDTSDINPMFAAENLPINDQESIIELIVEKVIGYENAIPEIDDCDPESNSIMKKTVTVDFFILPHFVININQAGHNPDTKNLCLSKSDILKAYLEIHSPPPEA